jgi:sugar phosphate permease
MERPPGQGVSRAEAQIMWILWATYGAFYFCRTNISAALPGPDGLQAQLELSKAEIGTILGGLKLAYGLGQFINGQLAERVPARLLLAIGMFTSAALNVMFGLGTGFYFLLFVWAANGFFQSMGWTPCMKVVSRWFPPERRGRAVGLIGTGYQLAGAITFVVAGWAAQTLGWRGAHLVPAAMLALMGVFTLVALREDPREVAVESAPRPTADPGPGWRRTVWITITNPRLWLIAIALGLVDATRYGFIDWGITHLTEVSGGGVGKNALKYAVLPLGGIAGAFGAGWVSDRWFGGRRVPVLVALLLVLGVLSLLYHDAVVNSVTLSIVLLGLIGFCVYGPQVLLVGSAAMDVSRAGRPAAAVGFVNFFGYLGAFMGDQVTGYLAGAYTWSAAVTFWAICAFAAAVILLPLWRYSAVGRVEQGA